MAEATPEQIKKHLDRLLTSDALSKSGTSRRLLSYLAQRSFEHGDDPKEIEIAMEVFSRDASFNGAEDSVVRVAKRGLRQKLLEFYAGPGKDDEVIFDLPKGGYRLAVHENRRSEPPSVPVADSNAASDPPGPASAENSGRSDRFRHLRRLSLFALPVLAISLAISLAANFSFWRNQEQQAPEGLEPWIQASSLWAGVIEEKRPLMLVLGDLFMYTQADPVTGRTQVVRDPQINSSDDLRAFLAGNPSLAAQRGLRYSTVVQKSTALGTVALLRVLDRPGRRIEVRVQEELLADDIRTNDIIYVGPITRLGPLASHHHVQSRYRFDPATAGITDVVSGKVFVPEGERGAHYKDYALVARFRGPAGNSITLFTSGGRNSGLLQVIRTFTSEEGLQDFERHLKAVSGSATSSFEALVAVSGFNQTGLGAELLELHSLPVTADEARAGQDTDQGESK